MADRKSRLAALKQKRDGAKRKRGGEEEDNEAPEPKITFRNYQPRDDDLKDQQLEPTLAVVVATDKDAAKEEKTAELEAAESATVNIAPRKPNWDLKRDLETKMALLNKRTRRAVRALIRKRLEAEASGSDSDSSSSGSSSSSDSGE